MQIQKGYILIFIYICKKMESLKEGVFLTEIKSNNRTRQRWFFLTPDEKFIVYESTKYLMNETNTLCLCNLN